MAEMMVEGPRLVRFALEYAPDTIKKIFCEKNFSDELKRASRKIAHEVVTRERLDSIVAKAQSGDTENEEASGPRHAGIAAWVEAPEGVSVDELIEGSEPRVVVVLDQIQDVHNLGAIMRSALLLGAKGIIFAEDRSAKVTAAAVRVSSGMFLLNRFACVTNVAQTLRDLKEKGFWIAGLSAESEEVKGTQPLERLGEYASLALVVGNEHAGLRPLTLKTCDFTVTIPLKTEFQSVSLNASVATAVALSHLELADGPVV